MRRKQKQLIYTYTSGITDAVLVLKKQQDEFGNIAGIDDLIELLTARHDYLLGIEDMDDFDGFVRTAGKELF